jgi:hypothetical protein
MNSEPDWSTLKDYASFGDAGQKPAISLREYALSKLTPDLLVAVTRLFFPEFITYQGGVFLAERFAEALFNQWNRGQYRNDMNALERMINHVHLAEGYGNGFQQLSKQNLYYVGEVLVQTWKGALTHQFPGWSFTVQGTANEVGYGPDSGDFVITFWRNRETR